MINRIISELHRRGLYKEAHSIQSVIGFKYVELKKIDRFLGKGNEGNGKDCILDTVKYIVKLIRDQVDKHQIKYGLPYELDVIRSDAGLEFKWSNVNNYKDSWIILFQYTSEIGNVLFIYPTIKARNPIFVNRQIISLNLKDTYDISKCIKSSWKNFRTYWNSAKLVNFNSNIRQDGSKSNHFLTFR